jgi:hypothetical protein
MEPASIIHRLEQVFDPQQAAVLAEVIAAASSSALAADVAALAAAIRELTEAQRRTEERLEALAEAQRRTEERVEALAEAQRRTEERLSLVEVQLAALAEAQRHTEERVAQVEVQLAALAEAQRRTEERVNVLTQAIERLAEAQARADTRIGRLDGRLLELTYREKAGAYFGPLLRRMRVVAPQSLEDKLEEQLSPEEFQDVLQTDLVVSGRLRRPPLDTELWLAIEVSSAIDGHDVVRARRRAAALRRAGYPAVPVVAGERLTAEGEGEAGRDPVAIMLDGRVLHWDEALAALASNRSDRPDHPEGNTA